MVVLAERQRNGKYIIDLVATDDGYPIYKKLGFEDKNQKYKDMRLVVKN